MFHTNLIWGNFSGFDIAPLLAVALFSLSPIVFFLPLITVQFRFLVTVATAFLIAANNRVVNDYILGNSFFYFIGEISYSVYLYHWPLILFMRYFSRTNELTFSGLT